MSDAEFQLQTEIAELRRQVAVLREERERWRRLPVPLTDEERDAISFGRNATLYVADNYRDGKPELAAKLEQRAAAISGFLERTGGGR